MEHPDPAGKLSSKSARNIPLPNVQKIIPDDGQTKCPKHVEYPDPPGKLSSKPARNIPLPNVQKIIPDYGQRKCPKHVEYSDPPGKLSSKPARNIPLPNVQKIIPDDGQRKCPKHVEYPDPAGKLSSKPARNMPLPNVQKITPDDGQRKCPKHVEYFDKIKFGEIRASGWFYCKEICYDARSHEQKVGLSLLTFQQRCRNPTASLKFSTCNSMHDSTLLSVSNSSLYINIFHFPDGLFMQNSFFLKVTTASCRPGIRAANIQFCA